MSSSDIDNILVEAISLAKRFGHEYVTLEHLTTVVMEDNVVKSMCHDIQADGLGLQEALMLYLGEDCKELVIDSDIEVHPRKTHMLERVFNRALTQALFQGKRGINQFDLIVSILSEDQSAAVKFAEELGLSRAKVINWYQNTQGQAMQEIGATRHQMNKPDNRKVAMEILEQFCVNMNEVSGEYDDVVGRREELRDLVQTLARKKRSNAILVGPSGVGKTAIVEGLAKLIVEGNVPETIEKQTVYLLDISKLVAGTKYRGDFEERMKQLAEALEIVDDVIIFIDEIHMIIGAGQTGQGSMDAGNMLKSSLTSGKLKVIGATTDEEYRKMFDKEAALQRRFTKIQVDEPSTDEAKEILRNTIISYEVYHGIDIDFSACDLAVDLSAQYIFNKKLPDKAFDVIDRACAYNRIMPEDDRVDAISVNEIRAEVSRSTGIPVEHLGTKTEKETVKKHSQVEEFLLSTVFGQDAAVNRVCDAISVSLAGLKDPNKPVGSFLFTGPTGVGKTELAKRLAQGMGMKLVRYDMGEYQERHAVSKLIGSPPGYVGHGDGKAGDGLLINELEDNPNCVVLLDEVEKAHPDIMSVLLSLLDDGIITGSTGKKVSAKNCIVIMTSNLGAREGAVKAIGFNDKQYNEKAVVDAINAFFAPEFRNRLDAIVKFDGLKPENMKRIVMKFLRQIEGYVEGRKISIVWRPKLIEYLEKKGFDPAMGARPLARLINEQVKLPMSKVLLGKNKIDTIFVNYIEEDDKIMVRTEIDEELQEA